MGKFVRANRKKLVGLFQIALSLILLVWLLSRVGLGEVVATLARINWYWYALAFLLFQLNVVIRAYRWYVLLRALNDEPRFGYLVYLYSVCLLYTSYAADERSRVDLGGRRLI